MLWVPNIIIYLLISNEIHNSTLPVLVVQFSLWNKFKFQIFDSLAAQVTNHFQLNAGGAILSIKRVLSQPELQVHFINLNISIFFKFKFNS